MTLYFLLIVVVFLVSAVGLAGHGLRTLTRQGVRRSGPVLRALAACAAAATLALYAWGMLFVTGAVLEAEDGGADSTPIIPCRTAGWQEKHPDIVDYTVDYVPLRFVCVTTSTGHYSTDDVPGYVNPALLSLAVTAVALAGCAALESEYRARSGDRKRTG